MPDALIFAKEQAECFQLSTFLEQKGQRVKFSFDFATVCEWLKIKSFDIAFIDYRLGLDDQQKVATLLWERSPQSSIVLYNLDQKGRFNEKQARLFGAELAYGERALSHIAHILEKGERQRLISKGDLRILVVDDLDSPRDIVCSVIESLGFSSVTS